MHQRGRDGELQLEAGRIVQEGHDEEPPANAAVGADEGDHEHDRGDRTQQVQNERRTRADAFERLPVKRELSG